jgi:HEAT repeat protein
VNEQFCAACFHLVPADATACPACGADLAALSARDYQDKLLAALHHPLSEVRMRAIIALGWRGEALAAEPLVRCALRHPTDVVEGLQVVESLARLRDAGVARQALHTLQAQHPAHAVRVAAGQAEQALNRDCNA